MALRFFRGLNSGWWSLNWMGIIFSWEVCLRFLINNDIFRLLIFSLLFYEFCNNVIFDLRFLWLFFFLFFLLLFLFNLTFSFRGFTFSSFFFIFLNFLSFFWFRCLLRSKRPINVYVTLCWFCFISLSAFFPIS